MDLVGIWGGILVNPSLVDDVLFYVGFWDAGVSLCFQLFLMCLFLLVHVFVLMRW